MTRYNHMFSIAFSVVSNEPDGSDVDAAMLRAALLRRIADLEAEPVSDSWEEACGAPDDSYEEE
jgi:hypothetical protein